MALLNTRETHPKSVVVPACFRAEFSLICAKCRREALENKGELGHAVHLANDKWRGNHEGPLLWELFPTTVYTPSLQHLNYQKFLKSCQRCSMLDLPVQSDGIKMFYLSSAFPRGGSA